MRRPLRLTLTVGVLASVLMAGTSFARPSSLPGEGWWTGEVIQNVGDGPAQISITPYDTNGNALATVNRTNVLQNGITQFVPSDFTDMQSGFTGSAVVSSDKDILAIVNITNSQNGSLGTPGGLAKAQYQGTSATAASTELRFPLAKNDYYGQTTTFYIQNTDSANAANITFNFSMQNGVTCSNNPYTVNNVPASAQVAVSPADAGCGSGNVALGSLVVTSNMNVAGTLVQSDTTAPPDGTKVGSATRGLSPDMYDTTVYVPFIKKTWYNKFTGLQIQNASSSQIAQGAIQITFTVADCLPEPCGITNQITQSSPAALNPGDSWVTTQDSSSPLPDNSLWSATITSPQNIVVLNTESSVAGASPQTKVLSFGLPNSKATTKISLPSVKENWYGRYTGFQVQSVGSPTVMTATYTYQRVDNSTGVVIVHTAQPQSTFTFYRLSEDPVIQGKLVLDSGNWSDLAGNGTGTLSGVVVTSSGANIVGVSNEACRPCNTPTSQTADNNNYEGFNLTP